MGLTDVDSSTYNRHMAIKPEEVFAAKSNPTFDQKIKIDEKEYSVPRLNINEYLYSPKFLGLHDSAIPKFLEMGREKIDDHLRWFTIYYLLKSGNENMKTDKILRSLSSNFPGAKLRTISPEPLPCEPEVGVIGPAFVPVVNKNKEKLAKQGLEKVQGLIVPQGYFASMLPLSVVEKLVSFKKAKKANLPTKIEMIRKAYEDALEDEYALSFDIWLGAMLDYSRGNLYDSDAYLRSFIDDLFHNLRKGRSSSINFLVHASTKMLISIKQNTPRQFKIKLPAVEGPGGEEEFPPLPTRVKKVFENQSKPKIKFFGKIKKDLKRWFKKTSARLKKAWNPDPNGKAPAVDKKGFFETLKTSLQRVVSVFSSWFTS